MRRALDVHYLDVLLIVAAVLMAVGTVKLGLVIVRLVECAR